jgi:hypothetical protein
MLRTTSIIEENCMTLSHYSSASLRSHGLQYLKPERYGVGEVGSVGRAKIMNGSSIGFGLVAVMVRSSQNRDCYPGFKTSFLLLR